MIFYLVFVYYVILNDIMIFYLSWNGLINNINIIILKDVIVFIRYLLFFLFRLKIINILNNFKGKWLLFWFFVNKGIMKFSLSGIFGVIIVFYFDYLGDKFNKIFVLKFFFIMKRFLIIKKFYWICYLNNWNEI